MRFLFIFSLFLLSCGYNPKLTEEDLTFPKSAKLDYEIIPTDFDFKNPFQIVVHDSLLLVQDYLSRDISYHIFCAKTGNFIKSFGSIGRAGGELITPSSLYEVSRGVYSTNDLNSKKIVSYIVDSVLADSRDYFYEFKFDNVKRCSPFDLIGNNLLVSKYDGGRFGLLNTLTGTIKTLYSTYPDVVKYKEDWVLSQLFNYGNSIYAVSPDKKKMAAMTYLGAVAEVFDINDDSLTLRAEKCFAYPAIKVVQTWIEADKENLICGFHSVTATDKYIYAVYDGSISSFDTKVNTICVFDWNLNPIIKYTLDVEYILSFDYNKESGEAYAVVTVGKDVEIIKINEKFIL